LLIGSAEVAHDPQPLGADGAKIAARMGTDPRSIRILAVDDHALLREGIAALIATEPGMTLVGTCSNGREAIQEFRTLRPDVTLMDLQMPEMSGLDAIIAIRSEFPDARIIVLSTYAGDAQVVRALKAGASGYLLKNLVHNELLDTIRSVHAGRRSLSPEVSIELATHSTDDPLTPAEINVLRLIAAGNSNKHIADQLGITEDTVKGRVRNLLSKLGANDRTHAVTIGLKRGIIQLT
jgi:DNA-binding NarL/FixJ family response regulator